jgi:hypothetical protein
LVKKHLAKLRQREAAGDEGQESSEEEDKQEETQFFRRGADKTKAKKTDPKSKKKGKKAVAKCAAVSAKRPTAGGSRCSAVSVYGGDVPKRSGDAGSVASNAGKSIGSVSAVVDVVASSCGGAGAAASSRSTLAGGADKDSKVAFYFNFQSIREGLLDRNALNGVFDS